MKKYNDMKNGERQVCPHCGENKERSYWFLNGQICDWCIDNNQPCAICHKLKNRFTKYDDPKEVICVKCKNANR